jgi:hypothetical protein
MLYVLIFILSLIDALFTTYYLQTNKAIEANPLMAWLISHYGFISFIVIKQLVVGSSLIVLFYFRKSRPTIIFLSLLFLLVIYGSVVVWHLLHWR